LKASNEPESPEVAWFFREINLDGKANRAQAEPEHAEWTAECAKRLAATIRQLEIEVAARNRASPDVAR
jgi:hypothetical protein